MTFSISGGSIALFSTFKGDLNNYSDSDLSVSVLFIYFIFKMIFSKGVLKI